MKIIQLLLTFNPFVSRDPNLRCLQSGLCSSKENDKVNCENAEVTGANIHTELDNKYFNDISFKRSDCVVTLVALQKSIKTNGETLHFDPLRLFSRLIFTAERTDKFIDYFQYELTQEPTALFKDGFMRESHKSDVKNILLENTRIFENYPSSKIVVDGGALLHQVSLKKSCTYSEVIDQYFTYLSNNYGLCIVAFDGYGNGASTKDHEHRKRTKGILFPNIKTELKMIAYNNHNDFLSNDQNKAQFISFLANHLRGKGFTVHRSLNDADRLILKCAIELAAVGNVRTVIADDTDILVLNPMWLIFFCSH